MLVKRLPDKMHCEVWRELGNSHYNVHYVAHLGDASVLESNSPRRSARLGGSSQEIRTIRWHYDPCEEDQTPISVVISDNSFGFGGKEDKPTYMNTMRTLQKVCLIALGKSLEGFFDSAAVIASISVPQ